MKRILITGITGFLGKNLTKYLGADKELELFGHSRDPDKAKRLFQETPITIIGDDPVRAINECNVDAVIHLAGIAHDLDNRYSPEDYESVNHELTVKIYGGFVRSQASKFIFLSSIKAAVDVSSVPVDETVVPNPVTEYGQSKFKAEKYVQSVVLPAGKRYYILRPCMVYGEGNKGNLNLFYRYVRLGLPYVLGAFNNRRSFLSVENLVFVISRLLNNEVESGIFHLSDNDALSTTELYKLIADSLGKRARVWNLPPGLIRLSASAVGKKLMLEKLTENMLVSNRKAQETLGAFPVNVRDGIRKTIQMHA